MLEKFMSVALGDSNLERLSRARHAEVFRTYLGFSKSGIGTRLYSRPVGGSSRHYELWYVENSSRLLRRVNYLPSLEGESYLLCYRMATNDKGVVRFYASASAFSSIYSMLGYGSEIYREGLQIFTQALLATRAGKRDELRVALLPCLMRDGLIYEPAELVFVHEFQICEHFDYPSPFHASDRLEDLLECYVIQRELLSFETTVRHARRELRKFMIRKHVMDRHLNENGFVEDSFFLPGITPRDITHAVRELGREVAGFCGE